MSVTRIATRYAKSLLELALQQGKLDEVSKDIAQLGRATANKELNNMFKSPIITADKKINVIDALFKDRVSPLTLQYMHLLTNKGREPYLAAIAAEFEKQYKAIKQETDVKVILSAPASEEVMAQLKKKLIEAGVTSANINFNVVIDPAIIGGYILEFQDKRYDASVANKLAEYKVEFDKNLYIREF